jgi:hypothetical protein
MASYCRHGTCVVRQAALLNGTMSMRVYTYKEIPGWGQSFTYSTLGVKSLFNCVLNGIQNVFKSLKLKGLVSWNLPIPWPSLMHFISSICFSHRFASLYYCWFDVINLCIVEVKSFKWKKTIEPYCSASCLVCPVLSCAVSGSHACCSPCTCKFPCSRYAHHCIMRSLVVQFSVNTAWPQWNDPRTPTVQWH